MSQNNFIGISINAIGYQTKYHWWIVKLVWITTVLKVEPMLCEKSKGTASSNNRKTKVQSNMWGVWRGNVRHQTEAIGCIYENR